MAQTPSSARGACWIAAFFSVGVAIGLSVSLLLLEKGSSAAYAVALGAMAGGYGAWAVFAAGYRIRQCLHRDDNNTRSDLPAAAT